MVVVSVAIFGVFLVILGIGCSNGLTIFPGKRQGLIPFPRVGRTMIPLTFTDSLPDSLYWTTTDDMNDDPDDVFTLRYARALIAPRLGRRKRSLDADSDIDDAPTVEDINQLLRVAPWAIYAYKDKKTAFSPRLGRASVAAMSPRLGKKSYDMSSPEEKRIGAFSPRLGRSKVQVGISNRGAFSPRLGRAGPNTFSPRLGRTIGEGYEAKAR